MFLIRSLAFKIIGLFILNILLLAGVFLFAARSQLSEELDSVIGKEISRKLWEINASIQQEMDDVPLEQWNTLLDYKLSKVWPEFPIVQCPRRSTGGCLFAATS